MMCNALATNAILTAYIKTALPLQSRQPLGGRWSRRKRGKNLRKSFPVLRCLD